MKHLLARGQVWAQLQAWTRAPGAVAPNPGVVVVLVVMVVVVVVVAQPGKPPAWHSFSDQVAIPTMGFLPAWRLSSFPSVAQLISKP